MSLKLLGKNTAIYAFGNVGMRAAAFLLIPLYTHSLSISEYGILATLQLTIQMMFVFMSSGMRDGLVRFTKEFKDNNNYNQLLGTSSMINVFAGLVVSVISLSLLTNFFRTIFHIANVLPYIGLICGATLSQSLSLHLMAHYRAEEKAFKFMVIGVVSSLALIVVNGIFIYGFDLGVKGALWASIATYSILLLFLFGDIFPKTGFCVSCQVIPKLLQFGFPLIFSQFASMLMGGVSIYFISYYAGLQAVAIFSMGSKLASVLSMSVILPLHFALQPFVFLNIDKKEIRESISKLVTYFVLVMTFMFFFILLGSRFLLPVIAPPEYSSAFLVILLLLPGTIFTGINSIGEILLGAAKKTHIIGFVMTIFAIISIGLNYLLIPIMQWYGAVIAINFSFILSGLVFFSLGRKYFPFSIEWKRVSFAGGIIIFFFLLFFVLDKVSLLSFTVISLLAGLGSIVILFKLQFFSPDERTLMKKFFQRRTIYEI